MRIGELARQSGISVATLRAWERRYGLPNPKRTASGQRLYSEDDLAQITTLRALSQRGWSLAAAANAVRAGDVPAGAGDEPVAASVEPLPSRLHGQLLDAVRESVIATTLDGIINYWNPASERLYGWRADEVIGRDIVNVVLAPDQRDEGKATMQELVAGRFTAREHDLIRRDGSRFRANVINEGLRDGPNLRGIIGVSWDLTERDKNARVGHLRAAELESIAVLGLQRARGVGTARVTEEAARTVRRVLATDCAAVYIRNGADLDLIALAGGSRSRRPIGEGHDALAHHAIAIERAVISNQLRSERRFDSTALVGSHGAYSAIAVPIPAVDRPRGAIMVTSTEARTFTAEDGNYLQAIANVIASAHDMVATSGT